MKAAGLIRKSCLKIISEKLVSHLSIKEENLNNIMFQSILLVRCKFLIKLTLLRRNN